MTDRPYVHDLTSELRERAKAAKGDVAVLHQVYVETLFRSRKQARELRQAVSEEISKLHDFFPWPTTDAKPGHNTLDNGRYQYAKGVLGLMGYRVGASGVSSVQRRELLRHIYIDDLPRINSQNYMAQWGAPQSSARLRKLANSLASFARAAKRKDDQVRYAKAISQWESDLAYLKRTYYLDKYSFRWPSSWTSVSKPNPPLIIRTSSRARPPTPSPHIHS